MENAIKAFQQFIHALPLPEGHESTAQDLLQNLEKEYRRIDFKLERTIKDKHIVIKLLEKTILELRKQQKEVEAANGELLIQKKLIEMQSQELSENLHMLEKSYAELEQFSYIASHDLKSPLRTIASYAGLLKRRYFNELDIHAIEFIDYVVKGASHMNDIIQDLLEYSNVNKAQIWTSIDLNEMLFLVLQNLDKEITESKAKILFPKLPTINGFKTGMSQLFQNLIANAIKFKSDLAPVISIQVENRAAHWQFIIADNGVGLEERYQEKAFQPFQRINNLERPGTGMGLAICKKIVNKHKGEIWYKSKAGCGTSFYFTISKDAGM